jgi:peptide/nickel transport system permease protein
MSGRLLRAFAGFAGTLFAVSVVSFLLIALLILADSATPERVAALRAELGLDRPLPIRYLMWLGNVLQGDFGRGIHSGEPTLQVILSRLPVTIELIVLTQILALVLSIPGGIWSAYRRGSALDHGTLVASIALLSVPPFVLALAMIYFFALQLQWLPATGFVSLSESVVENLESIAMPVAALALVEVPVYLRMLRSEMVTTLQQNFVALARGMGLPTWRILFVNAFKPSSLGLITVVGINMGRLMGGAIIVETMFALPGVGQLLVESIYQQEYQVTQGIVLFVAFAFILINLATDVVYVLVDPRLARDGEA